MGLFKLRSLVDDFVKEGREEGILEGILEGREEGRLEGILESKLEIAKRMLDSDLSVDQIIECTGLSKEDIEKL